MSLLSNISRRMELLDIEFDHFSCRGCEIDNFLFLAII